MTTFSTPSHDLESPAHRVGKTISRMFQRAVHATRICLGHTGQAHARLAAAAAIGEAILTDVGLDRETILGHSDHEADLPFFMQRRFGQK